LFTAEWSLRLYFKVNFSVSSFNNITASISLAMLIFACFFNYIQYNDTSNLSCYYVCLTSEKKYRYNVTVRHVRLTKIVVRSRKYSILRVCVCNPTYPASKELAPYHIGICDLLALPYFSTLSQKWHHFSKKKLFNIKWMFSFYLQHFWNTFRYNKKWARYDQNVYWSLCHIPVILARFKWNLNFLDKFSKNTQRS